MSKLSINEIQTLMPLVATEFVRIKSHSEILTNEERHQILLYLDELSDLMEKLSSYTADNNQDIQRKYGAYKC